MLPMGLTIQQPLTPGDWRIVLSPPMSQDGRISGTSYPSFEEAKKAAEEGIYD